jgi:acyl-CoA synthetase (AMP-forming)/AMP-acid ligase II
MAEATPLAAPPRLALDAARRMSHGEQLARAARKHPDRVALICRDESRTYRQFDARVSRLARALQASGVGAGDRLAVLMGNSLEMVETIFAGWRIGAILVPVNFRLVASEVQYVLSDSSASVIVADKAYLPLIEDVRPELPDLRRVIIVGASDGVAFDRFDDLLDDPTDEPLVIEVDDQTSAIICYTSGTTGRPKGAVLTHFNLVMSTLNSMVEQQFDPDNEVWYVNMPLFHIGGLSGVLLYLMLGGTSVIVPSGNFSAAAAVKDLERHGVTGCVFVGMQWDEVCDEVEKQQPKLCLRRASWGAATTPVHVLAKMSKALPGVPVYSFFGQTEMSPVTCSLNGRDAIRKMGSVGKPIVNVEARIVDDDMNDVSIGEVGEIVYRGPTVMQGYWNMPRATDEAFEGGWFHSGDLCRMDDEGYIYVVDRKKDMIISGGENIYCPEVEAVLMQHPGIADASVIGVPHARWGETPRAIVVPVDPARPPSQEEITAWCQSRLASYKKPTSIIIVDDLPRNATGKVVNPTLRERLGSQLVYEWQCTG